MNPKKSSGQGGRSVGGPELAPLAHTTRAAPPSAAIRRTPCNARLHPSARSGGRGHPRPSWRIVSPERQARARRRMTAVAPPPASKFTSVGNRVRLECQFRKPVRAADARVRLAVQAAAVLIHGADKLMTSLAGSLMIAASFRPPGAYASTSARQRPLGAPSERRAPLLLRRAQISRPSAPTSRVAFLSQTPEYRGFIPKGDRVLSYNIIVVPNPP
jgi:hypothetical protein